MPIGIGGNQEGGLVRHKYPIICPLKNIQFFSCVRNHIDVKNVSPLHEILMYFRLLQYRYNTKKYSKYYIMFKKDIEVYE